MTLRALIAMLAILVPTALFAHEGPGPHGGQRVDAGPYDIELVTDQGQLKVFVYNHETEKPENIKAGKGTATVLLGQQRETVTLQPDAAEKDGNLLTGKLTVTPGPGLRVVVQLQIPGRPAIVARFAF
jgi:hypothetical protein